MYVADLRYVAPFQKKGDSKATGVEKSTFYTFIPM